MAAFTNAHRGTAEHVSASLEAAPRDDVDPAPSALSTDASSVALDEVLPTDAQLLPVVSVVEGRAVNASSPPLEKEHSHDGAGAPLGEPHDHGGGEEDDSATVPPVVAPEGAYHGIRQLMQARRAVHRRLLELLQTKQRFPPPTADAEGQGEEEAYGAPPTVEEEVKKNVVGGGERGDADASAVPFEFDEDNTGVLSNPVDSLSPQMNPLPAGANDSIATWRLRLYLRPDDDPTSTEDRAAEKTGGHRPFAARYGPAPTTVVHVVAQFHPVDPDVEAPMVRVVAPRIVGPSLFYGVVCANDLAAGEWSLSRVFDVLLALRTHLAQNCALEATPVSQPVSGGGSQPPPSGGPTAPNSPGSPLTTSGKDPAFTDVEAADGATYIATLHPEWRLPANASAEELAQARTLVEAAADDANRAAYLAQGLQQQELNLVRERQRAIAAERYGRIPQGGPVLLPDGTVSDPPAESTIQRLREGALHRLEEAAKLVPTGETLQRRACALFALERYADAYRAFVEVRRRYAPGSATAEQQSATAPPRHQEAKGADEDEGEYDDDEGGADNAGCAVSLLAESSGGATAAVCYELAHCSIKLKRPRRALAEALVAVRHSPPGPFAPVLQSIATSVAQTEEDLLRQAVHDAQVADYELHRSMRRRLRKQQKEAAVVQLRRQSQQSTGRTSTALWASTDDEHPHLPTKRSITSATRLREKRRAERAALQRAHDGFSTLQQAWELSPHNPRVVGAMALSLAVGGDARQAVHCMEMATTAAGIDAIAACLLEPPALTATMEALWEEHRRMVAGWLSTRIMIGRLLAKARARYTFDAWRNRYGEPIRQQQQQASRNTDEGGDTAGLLGEPDASPAAAPPGYLRGSDDNRPSLHSGAAAANSVPCFYALDEQMAPGVAGGGSPSSTTGGAIETWTSASSEIGQGDYSAAAVASGVEGAEFESSAAQGGRSTHADEQSAHYTLLLRTEVLVQAVYDLFNAFDAQALVAGAGRCELHEAAQSLQLTSMLNTHGPVPPYGSLIDLSKAVVDTEGKRGRRTVLPQHLDALLPAEEVRGVRKTLLGLAFEGTVADASMMNAAPSSATGLREAWHVNLAPRHPHALHETAWFRAMLVTVPTLSRQHYHAHLRSLALARMVERLRHTTLRQIAQDKLVLDRVELAWRLADGAGDKTVAAAMMQKGLLPYLTLHEEGALDADGPRWHPPPPTATTATAAGPDVVVVAEDVYAAPPRRHPPPTASSSSTTCPFAPLPSPRVPFYEGSVLVLAVDQLRTQTEAAASEKREQQQQHDETGGVGGGGAAAAQNLLRAAVARFTTQGARSCSPSVPCLRCRGTRSFERREASSSTPSSV